MRRTPLVEAAFAAFPGAEFVDDDDDGRPAATATGVRRAMKSMEEMIKAAQQAAETIQKQMGEAQAKLDTIEVEGVSGGGLVKIRCTAKGRVIGVSIDDSLIVPADKQMLEDLVAAAFNDARDQGRPGRATPRCSAIQQGMGLPPGFKLPM